LVKRILQLSLYAMLGKVPRRFARYWLYGFSWNAVDVRWKWRSLSSWYFCGNSFEITHYIFVTMSLYCLHLFIIVVHIECTKNIGLLSNFWSSDIVDTWHKGSWIYGWKWKIYCLQIRWSIQKGSTSAFQSCCIV